MDCSSLCLDDRTKQQNYVNASKYNQISIFKLEYFVKMFNFKCNFFIFASVNDKHDRETEYATFKLHSLTWTKHLFWDHISSLQEVLVLHKQDCRIGCWMDQCSQGDLHNCSNQSLWGKTKNRHLNSALERLSSLNGYHLLPSYVLLFLFINLV